MNQPRLSTTPEPEALQHFRLALLKFTLRAEQQIALPEFAGSTFRGAFGAMFRRLACMPQCEDVQTCLVASHCAYARVFEARPAVAGYRPASEGGLPRPFVIHPPLENRSIGAGTEFSFHLALIGLAIDYLPYFILTWRELGRVGMGRGRGRFHLERVESCRSLNEESFIIYSSADELVRNNLELITTEGLLTRSAPLRQVAASDRAKGKVHMRIELLTPTRLKSGGEFLRTELPFSVLLSALLRRLESLSFFYCGGSLQLDYKALIARAEEVAVVENSLRWVSWERYSRRQERKIPWGGIMGCVEYRGDFTPFLPFLALGELVGVGNNCAFGLGRYQTHLKGEG